MRRPAMRRAVFVFVVFSAISICSGDTIYVDFNAPGANNGSSWEDAFNFLQDGLADANSSPKPVEIRVAEGIYTPDSNSAEPNGTGDREATFKLINEVTLKGGYAGSGQPDPNIRDIELYETILSGDLDGNDVEVGDACDLFNEPTRGENSFHVAIGGGWDGAPTGVLDGFTVVGGNANYTGGRGGGIYGFDGLISNCTISSNSAHIHGGGTNYCHGKIQNCTISGNQSTRTGGGIYISWSEPEIINCIISGNIASGDDYSSGGGLYSHASSPTLIGCTFSGNSAAQFGGGMYCEASDNGSSPTLTNCTFNSNSARSGGGLYDSEGKTVITNCKFSTNSAKLDGGAIYNNYNYSDQTLTNCVFSGNFAVQAGGGIFNKTDPSSRSIITNCTFVGNLAYNGRALACDSRSHLSESNIQSVDCILWDGGDEIWNNDGSTITISYTDLQGGQAACFDPCDAIVWDLGNIDADPLFADEDANDFHLQSEAGRWDSNSQSWVTDSNTSPCIDAGDWMTPVGNEPFPNGGRINMGAYGGTVEASKSYFGEPLCETIIAGDINGDCKVDFIDFAIMSMHWLEDARP
jgi:parallel beta-helix repeat protein/predicted outer membrane repeat protein